MKKLNAEVKTRVPRRYKIRIEAIATLRYLTVSDILREAIREKLDRDIEQKAASR